ncbi:phosphorothioated DNA-binding restriction endonuclease [Longivirga aurantiaca]|uniref:Phosphorothioated DNA-binding restriction endonuclease n=1 Tax=Longivirga aurantiaca TaxID=1837743 RepID=A0ABW1T1R3_9ACTN
MPDHRQRVWHSGRVGVDPVERLLALQQYRHNGARVPHKPLLVLLALQKLATTGSSDLAWSEAEDRLAGLIAEFGPTTKTSRPQSAAYPFTRLRADGVWALSVDVPDDLVTPLRETDVHGRLDPAIDAALIQDPRRLEGVVRSLVDAQFPSTIAPDVLLAVGFDPELLAPGLAAVTPEERKRSVAWRDAIVRAWDGACAFCGYDGSLGGAPVGIEAAHVRWFKVGGPDELDNGLALCSLHHKLFDRGALGLSPDARVQVSEHFRASGVGKQVYDLHGRELRPRPGAQLPAPVHVEWHRTQVFRGDPLAA